MVDSANLVDYSFVPSAQTCCEQPVPQPSTSGTAAAKLINIGSGNPRNESYRMASSGLPQKLFGCLLLRKWLPSKRVSKSLIWFPENLADSLDFCWAICSDLLRAAAAPQPSTSEKATQQVDEFWLGAPLAMNHTGRHLQDCHKRKRLPHDSPSRF